MLRRENGDCIVTVPCHLHENAQGYLLTTLSFPKNTVFNISDHSNGETTVIKAAGETITMTRAEFGESISYPFRR
jgi:hypothetical protein